MNFAERATARKKSKELKSEFKNLRKELVNSGEDKAQVAARLKELQEAAELADTLQSDYVEAREHLGAAREAIEKLLDDMGDSSAAEVQTSMNTLLGELEQIYHECSIREDDMDFQSTIRGLKQLTEDCINQGKSTTAFGMEMIMLRSELENIKAVLDDAAAWNAPDFLALAYYFLHEDKSSLKEMENRQRNQCVRTYFAEHYMDSFSEQCRRAGNEEHMQTLLREYIYN